MNKHILVFALSLVASCGAFEHPNCYIHGECGSRETAQNDRTTVVVRGEPGPAGTSCHTYESETEVIFVCGDTESAFVKPIQPVAGRDGVAGPRGASGASCDIQHLENGALITCGDTSAIVLNGQDGASGAAGASGASCTVQQAEEGARITCEDGSSAVVLNGEPGEDGTASPSTGLEIVEIIDPCGSSETGPHGPIQFHEVLLKLSNGAIIGHYSHGSKQHLVQLPPGSYETTQGGQECAFSITVEGEVVW